MKVIITVFEVEMRLCIPREEGSAACLDVCVLTAYTDSVCFVSRMQRR